MSPATPPPVCLRRCWPWLTTTMLAPCERFLQTPLAPPVATPAAPAAVCSPSCWPMPPATRTLWCSTQAATTSCLHGCCTLWTWPCVRILRAPRPPTLPSVRHGCRRCCTVRIAGQTRRVASLGGWCQPWLQPSTAMQPRPGLSWRVPPAPFEPPSSRHTPVTWRRPTALGSGPGRRYCRSSSHATPRCSPTSATPCTAWLRQAWLEATPRPRPRGRRYSRRCACSTSTRRSWSAGRCSSSGTTPRTRRWRRVERPCSRWRV